MATAKKKAAPKKATGKNPPDSQKKARAEYAASRRLEDYAASKGKPNPKDPYPKWNANRLKTAFTQIKEGVTKSGGYSGDSVAIQQARKAGVQKKASTPKSGAGYAKNNRGYGGDLAGRGGPIQKVYKGGDTSISIGIPERGRGRTNQRAIDQFKRKKK